MNPLRIAVAPGVVVDVAQCHQWTVHASGSEGIHQELDFHVTRLATQDDGGGTMRCLERLHPVQQGVLLDGHDDVRQFAADGAQVRPPILEVEGLVVEEPVFAHHPLERQDSNMCQWGSTWARASHTKCCGRTKPARARIPTRGRYQKARWLRPNPCLRPSRRWRYTCQITLAMRRRSSDPKCRRKTAPEAVARSKGQSRRPLPVEVDRGEILEVQCGRGRGGPVSVRPPACHVALDAGLQSVIQDQAVVAGGPSTVMARYEEDGGDAGRVDVEAHQDADESRMGAGHGASGCGPPPESTRGRLCHRTSAELCR